MGEQFTSSDATAMLYKCAECGADNWRKYDMKLSHYFRRTECEECGHTIKDKYEL